MTKKNFRRISVKKISGTNQMILRFIFKVKKKKIRWKNVRKIFEIFFYRNFFLWAGASTPGPLPGLRPWTPHAFWLRTLVGTGSRSTAFQQKIWSWKKKKFDEKIFEKFSKKNVVEFFLDFRQHFLSASGVQTTRAAPLVVFWIEDST